MELEEIAARLARLEAVEAVKACKHRYLRACDAKDVAAFRDSFADGPVELDYGPMGVFEAADDLTDVFRSFALLTDDDGRYRILDMHHAVHGDVAIVDDALATGEWTLRFRQVDTVARVERLSAIEYEDRYVRQADRWRIVASRAIQRWMLERPLADDATIRESIHG